MGIRVLDWHNLQHIWSTYKVKPLAYFLAQCKLNRLLETKYPHIAFFAQLKGATYGRGRPP